MGGGKEDEEDGRRTRRTSDLEVGPAAACPRADCAPPIAGDLLRDCVMSDSANVRGEESEKDLCIITSHAD